MCLERRAPGRLHAQLRIQALGLAGQALDRAAGERERGQRADFLAGLPWLLALFVLVSLGLCLTLLSRIAYRV